MPRTRRSVKPELGEILRGMLELWHWQGELIQSALREAREVAGLERKRKPGARARRKT